MTIHEVARILVSIESSSLSWQEYDLLVKLRGLVIDHSNTQKQRAAEDPRDDRFEVPLRE